MSYDAYAQMKEEAGAACYELLMANPVKNFVLSFVQDKFPIGQGVIVENSRRFSAGRLFALLGEFGQRSMQRYGVVYPYWENAARCAEDWCTLLLALGVLFALFPVCVLLGLLFGLIRRTKAKLTEQVLPGLYFVLVGVVCAAAVMFGSGQNPVNPTAEVTLPGWVLIPVSLGIFLLSWPLSIALYKKREF